MNLNFFKKKLNKNCFFCDSHLIEETTFTLQYASKEGLHSQKICGECAKVMNELVDMMEEMNDERIDTV